MTMYEDEECDQNGDGKPPFELVFTPTFTKNLRELKGFTRRRILRRLEGLEVNPYANCTKLSKVEVGVFRIRVGNWSMRYDVEGNKVILHRVRHRREAYRNLDKKSSAP